MSPTFGKGGNQKAEIIGFIPAPRVQFDLGSVFGHKWISIVCRRYQGFFDSPRRGPADHVQEGTGLIIGAGSSSPAEGLLTNDCPGRFVIDIEITGGVA